MLKTQQITNITRALIDLTFYTATAADYYGSNGAGEETSLGIIKELREFAQELEQILLKSRRPNLTASTLAHAPGPHVAIAWPVELEPSGPEPQPRPRRRRET